MTRASRWVGCLCLALVVGCGEDLFNDMNMQGDQQGDGDSGGDQSGNGDGPSGNIEGPRSGVDGQQSVTDLSDADASKFCTWAAEKVSALVPTPEQLCTIYALGSEDPSQCASARDTCLEQSAGAPVQEEEADPSECVANVGETLESGCDVTVAELEACFNDSLAQVQGIFDGISCDSGPGGLPSEEPEEPASCKLIDEKCPEFAVDSGDTGGPQPGDGDSDDDGYPEGDYPGDGLPDDASGDGDAPSDGEPEPQASCLDGQPLDLSQFCDGNVDCSQGEDEAYCEELPAPRPSLNLVKKLPFFR